MAGCPERRLEVLGSLTEEGRAAIRAYLADHSPSVTELDTENTFEIDLRGTVGEHTARVRFVERHTGIVLVECDGEDLTEDYVSNDCGERISTTDRSVLNVESIVEYADAVSLDELRPLLLRQIEMNMAIAEEGLSGGYGAAIGALLYSGGTCSVKDRARAYAAAGSDARMSGCEKPVCILSGSGNQGITASVPVVVYARDMGVDEDLMLRALIVSDLITIHQKTGIGCLSAYCGAISAGCGAGCGICYLHGGKLREIAHTLVNSVAILSGTICDGAKPSCAAKISMAVEAGIMGYEMTVAGHQFYGGDGIVTKGVEKTLRNIGRLAKDGMSATDREIIRIMLGQD